MLPSEIAVISRALARQGISDSRLFELFVDRLFINAKEATSKDFVDILESFSKLHISDADLFTMAAEVLPDYLDELSGSQLATLLSAFATAGYYDAHLVNCILDEVSARTRDLSVIDMLKLQVSLSDIHCRLDESISLKRMEEKDKSFLHNLIKYMIPHAGPLSFEENLVWFSALVRMSYYDPRALHHKIIPRLRTQLDNRRNGINPVSLQELAAAVECIARLPAMSDVSAQLLHSCIALLPQEIRKSCEAAGRSVSRLQGLSYPIVRSLLSLHSIGQVDADVMFASISVMRTVRECASSASKTPAFFKGIPMDALVQLYQTINDNDNNIDTSDVQRESNLSIHHQYNDILSEISQVIQYKVHRGSQLPDGVTFGDGLSSTNNKELPPTSSPPKEGNGSIKSYVYDPQAMSAKIVPSSSLQGGHRSSMESLVENDLVSGGSQVLNNNQSILSGKQISELHQVRRGANSWGMENLWDEESDPESDSSDEEEKNTSIKKHKN